MLVFAHEIPIISLLCFIAEPLLFRNLKNEIMSNNSILLEFAMFPTDKGDSVSEYVSRIIKMIDESGYEYQLTPMGTIVEFPSMKEALALVEKSYDSLEPDCERVYSSLKFDIRKSPMGRFNKKVESIEKIIGEVSK